MELAPAAVARLQAQKAEFATIIVSSPDTMNTDAGCWGTKTVRAWASKRSLYLVGFNIADPNFTVRLYRKSIPDKPAGNENGNPTREIGVLSISRNLDYDMIQQWFESV